MRTSLSSTQIDARRRSSSDAALAPRRITGKKHARTTSRWRDLSARGSIRQETRDCWSDAEPERREREIDAQQGRKRARARSAGLLWSSRWPDWRTRPARQPRLLGQSARLWPCGLPSSTRAPLQEEQQTQLAQTGTRRTRKKRCGQEIDENRAKSERFSPKICTDQIHHATNLIPKIIARD